MPMQFAPEEELEEALAEEKEEEIEEEKERIPEELKEELKERAKEKIKEEIKKRAREKAEKAAEKKAAGRAAKPGVKPAPGAGVPSAPGVGMPGAPGAGMPGAPGAGMPGAAGAGVPGAAGAGVPGAAGAGVPGAAGAGAGAGAAGAGAGAAGAGAGAAGAGAGAAAGAAGAGAAAGAATLPVWGIAALVIIALIIIAVIVLAIIGNFMNEGSLGRSPEKYPNKNNSADVAELNETLALAGDPQATGQAAAAQAEPLIKAVEELENFNEEKKESQSTAYIKEIPQNNTSLAIISAANPANLAEKLTNDIKEMHLNAIPLATVSSADSAMQILNILSNILTKIEEKCTETDREEKKHYIDPEYKPYIEKIKSSLQETKELLTNIKNPRLIISAKDQYYIRTYQVDIRILKALNYLATIPPNARGGKGHWKLKVRRIKREYDSEHRKFSKEWGYPYNISPHFYGQAVDISAIDQIRRSLYKKGILRKKREMLPPKDILVAYQSYERGKGAGSSVSSTGETFAQLFESGAMKKLLEQLSSELDYDLTKAEIGTGSISEIIKGIGTEILSQELESTIDPYEDNSSFKKLVENIGQSVLADYLDVPKEALEEHSENNFWENMGREILAERLKLEPKSLSGNSSEEILISIGKRKIEKNLGIRRGSLDFLAPRQDFATFVGQIIIEQTLNLAGGNFAPNALEQIKEKINATDKKRFDNIFHNPQKIDALLGLETKNNYTSRFLKKNISPATYKKIVGNNLIQTKIKNFKDHLTVTGTGSQKDEAFDTPEGSINKLLAGNYSVFHLIGIDELAKRLTDNEAEREVIKLWIRQQGIYKNRKLRDFRYIHSSILKKTRIELKENVPLDNEEEIKKAREAAKAALDQSLKDLKRASYHAIDPDFLPFETLPLSYSFSYDYDYTIEDIESFQKEIKEKLESQIERTKLSCGERKWECAHKVAYAREAITALNKPLKALEEVRWQIILGDEAKWGQTREEYFNRSYGLPIEGLSDIFLRNKGNDVFYKIGQSEREALTYQDIKDEYFHDELEILYDLKKDTEETIEKLRERKKQGEDVNEQIEYNKETLKELESKIRMHELAITLRKRSQEKRGRLNITPDIIRKIFAENDPTISLQIVMEQIGSSLLEDMLDLPLGSAQRILTRSFRFQNTKKQCIGSQHIEEELNLPPGIFEGENIQDIIEQLKGKKTFFSYFFPEDNAEEMAENFPVRPENENWFRRIFKKADDRFKLEVGTTYDLMMGNISPDEYAEKVGKSYLKNRSAKNITGYLNTNVLGYEINKEDLENLLEGNFLNIALKVGAKNLDEAIDLPLGTMHNLINNPTPESIKNILAISGQEKLATFMGVFGDTFTSDNISENMGQAKIEQTLDPHSTLPAGWFNGATLKEVVVNIAVLSSPQALTYLAQYDKNTMRNAEKKLLSLFGFDPSYTLEKLEQIEFFPNSPPYITAKTVDEKLGLSVGTTAKLFKKQIGVGKYKKKVNKRYIENKTANWLEEALPEEIKEILKKYDISLNDLKKALHDPESLRNKALFAVLSPKEIGILLGLGIKLPIQGEFSENFAQQQIEEVLGLAPGSFSPNNSISDILNLNGAKRFAAAFRISLPNRNMGEEEIRSFLMDQVLKANSSYWQNPTHVFYANSIDNFLKLANPQALATENPTIKLLTGQVSVQAYIEMVRKNQFAKLKPEDFLSFLLPAKEDPYFTQFNQYTDVARTALDLLRNPDNLKDPRYQIRILEALKTVGNIDLDDAIGFTPGTIENLILHPDQARSILVAEGIRALSENLFGETTDNELLLAFQYFLPHILPKAYRDLIDPPDPNSCPPPFTVYEIDTTRSTCTINIKSKLADLIYKSTTIKDENDKTLAGGVYLPDEDLDNLLKGDLKVLGAVGFAFTVSTLKAQKDKKGNTVGIIPAGFQITYEEIRDAMWGSPKIKKQAILNASLEFRRNNPDLNPQSEEYREGLAQAIDKAVENAVPNARRKLMFRYLDAQLASVMAQNKDFPSIPPGFSETMFQGTSEERNNMFIDYGISYIMANELLGDLQESATVQNAINAYLADPNRDFDTFKDKLLDEEALRGEIFGLIDSELNKLVADIGIPIPTTGIAENLYNLATGKEVDPHFIDNWEAMGQNYISGLVDEKLGLPSGTTSRVYKIYKDLQAGNISTGDAIALIATAVFAEQLAKLDQKLGLPAGSSASIITAAIWGGPMAWAAAIVTILFGFSKIEYQVSCPGDYWSWCTETKQIYTQWAQINTRQLIDDMLRIEERTGEKGLLPNIIGTFRWEDFDYFYELEGGNFMQERYPRRTPEERFRTGIKGLHQSDYMKEFVHIGY